MLPFLVELLLHIITNNSQERTSMAQITLLSANQQAKKNLSRQNGGRKLKEKMNDLMIYNEIDAFYQVRSQQQIIKPIEPMTFISNDMLSSLGLGYSIVGLALVVPVCFAFRHYLRFLDHLQIFYLFYLGLASTTTIFSSYLGDSCALFPRNFYIFCVSGDLVCTIGFPLSFTSCLVAFLIFLRLVVAIQQCRKSEIRFEPVFTFFKGFFRWTYLILMYYSLFYLIQSIKGTMNYLLESAVVFGVTVLFPLIQLIAYKCIQKEDEDIWRKWIEFFSYLRLILIAVLVVTAQTMVSTAPYYFIYGIYVFYTIIYAWKSRFIYPIFGRIVFITGEICAMCISFFFIFELKMMQDYYLDLFFISFILLVDVIYYIAVLIYYYRYGVPNEDASEKVHPDSEGSRQELKNNAYDVEEIDNYDRRKRYRDSGYGNLNESNSNTNLAKSKVVRKRR